MRWLLLLPLLLAGCGGMVSDANTLLTEPLHITCRGKGETVISVGPYAGLIKSDCGDGFEYHLERAR